MGALSYLGVNAGIDAMLTTRPPAFLNERVADFPGTFIDDADSGHDFWKFD